MKSRNYGIDFLKFLAAIMITNSHYIPLYENYNIKFATLGVHGNALFFFISGFFLINIKSSDGQYQGFDLWIKRKILRLWPTLIVFYVFANLIFAKEINWYDLLLGGDYWFVRCFIVSFSIIYFFIRYLRSYLKLLLLLSIFLSSVYILLSPKVAGSIYHSFHYTTYFSTMMLGVVVGFKGGTIKMNNLLIDLLLSLISFLMYFVIMYFGKGKEGFYYYVQLLAILPLLSFLFYIFKVVSYNWCNLLSKTKIWPFIFAIASLTYEIYIVQFEIIKKYSFSNWFPFNTIVVFLIILFFAYMLRLLTNFFIQLFSKSNLNVRKIFKL